MYEQFQFMSIKENLQTYTILIEKEVIQSWEAVLRMNYGTPQDQKNSGKKFSFKDDCPDSGMIHITLYHTGKILLQAEKNKHSINIHFVNVHLESLYTQVYKMKPQISVHGVKVPTDILKQSPMMKKTRSKSLSLPCKECDFTANATQSMKDHISNAHQSIKTKKNYSLTAKVSCTFCGEGFKNYLQLSVHENEQHKEIVNPGPETHTCPICQTTETSHISLEAHMLNNHSPDVAAQCHICDKRFRYEDNMRIHIASEHETITMEPSLDISSNFEASLEEESEHIICEKCDFTTDNHDLFRKHIVAAHSPALICENCELTFFSKDLLDEHSEEYHSPSLQDTCEKCELVFTNSDDINKHLCEASIKNCLECNKPVKETEKHAIMCMNCSIFFHKKCTEFKSATGRHWKPSNSSIPRPIFLNSMI